MIAEIPAARPPYTATGQACPPKQRDFGLIFESMANLGLNFGQDGRVSQKVISRPTEQGRGSFGPGHKQNTRVFDNLFAAHATLIVVSENLHDGVS